MSLETGPLILSGSLGHFLLAKSGDICNKIILRENDKN
jgi:hypothetical protein